MPEVVILKGIIVAYRHIIEERYQYEKLKEKHALPPTITKDQINEIRSYFLTYIYPEFEKRKQLNEAFESLDDYIKNPRKLLQILIDSSSIIFKYGRHLPKILNSGIKALRSFRDANRFENQIVSAAERSKQQPPFDTATIYSFIRKLSREEIDQFIESSSLLFEILHDRQQVQKIIDIMAALISKMKANTNTYSKEEIAGLEIGYELISKGNVLFENLGKENQEQLIDFIVHVETGSLDQIYNDN